MAQRNTWHLIAKFLGIWIALMAAFIAYIFLSNEPFGIQLATLITYTLIVFCFVFIPSRLGGGFGLRSHAVRQCTPRLLRIHLVFLTLIFLVQTSAFALRPKLSNWWLQEGVKHDSLYSETLIIILLVTGMIQILLSRKILSRSHEPSATYDQ